MRAPRYFASRLKGHIKAAPIVILVSLLTAAAIAFLASAVVREATSGEDKDKLFKVGIVGDMDQKYLALVVDTMRNLDDSRLSIDFVNMDEDEARDELLSGGVIGYLVIPDGFIAAAARGEFIPAYYVTEGADTALGDALVSEFIGVAERLADETQKGVFGAERYFIDNGSNRKTVDRLTDGYTLSYAEYILNRNSTLDIDLVGEAVSLPLGGYYFSAFILFFAMLFGIGCASHLVKRDYSLPKLLASRRVGALSQILCEFAAYFIFSFVFLAAITAAGGAVAGDPAISDIFGGKSFADYLRFALYLAPACAMIAAFQILLYECVDGVVSGILLQFTAAIFTAYVSGYFYPSTFFPMTIQKIARVLPGGVAFSYAKGFFTEEGAGEALLLLLAYTVLFVSASAVLRKVRTGGDNS